MTADARVAASWLRYLGLARNAICPAPAWARVPTRETAADATVRFRPWLQAFRDYAFGGRPFTAGEVRSQIKAAEDFGANGWMLWNPGNRYSPADLRSRTEPGIRKLPERQRRPVSALEHCAPLDARKPRIDDARRLEFHLHTMSSAWVMR